MRDPSFSPDGQWLLYYSGGPGLYKIPSAGGTPTTVLPKVDAVRGASWAEDGAIVYAMRAPRRGCSASATAVAKYRADQAEPGSP